LGARLARGLVRASAAVGRRPPLHSLPEHHGVLWNCVDDVLYDISERKYSTSLR
jgi:hypothetical protein